MSYVGGARVIEIWGDRRSGRTERLIWLAAGVVLAEGSPVILTRTGPDYDQTRRRLADVLMQCGLKQEEAGAAARRATQPPEQPVGRGVRATIVAMEVDT